MRNHIRAGSLAVALTLSLGLAANVLADPPVNEVIADLVQFDADGGKTATWSSSGDFTDSGVVTSYPIFKFDGNSHLVHAVHTSEFGTFTIAAEINLRTHEGRWTITRGTGAYAGMHGFGTASVHFIDENTVLVVHEGVVMFL